MNFALIQICFCITLFYLTFASKSNEIEHCVSLWYTKQFAYLFIR